jgi:transcriptional regulator with XRE-family HTH domain
MSELPRPSDFCVKTTGRLISFWKFHRGFDANMADLARFTGVSRDTVYRWLNLKAYPRDDKARRIDLWLKERE